MFYLVFGKQPSMMGPGSPSTWVLVQGHDNSADALAQKASLLSAQSFSDVIVCSAPLVT